MFTQNDNQAEWLRFLECLHHRHNTSCRKGRLQKRDRAKCRASNKVAIFALLLNVELSKLLHDLTGQPRGMWFLVPMFTYVVQHWCNEYKNLRYRTSALRQSGAFCRGFVSGFPDRLSADPPPSPLRFSPLKLD